MIWGGVAMATDLGIVPQSVTHVGNWLSLFSRLLTWVTNWVFFMLYIFFVVDLLAAREFVDDTAYSYY